jgi:CheY-like chemotaxis protein
MTAALMSDRREVTILLAEDDPGHARLIEKNLRRANVMNKIVVVPDGQAAVDCLFADHTHEEHSRAPAWLVLLDLNMPVLDGYQVLQRMKADERTKRIPVVVLTTTDDPREVGRCYDLGCNVYITKPVDYEHFCEAVRQLGLFLSVITIPHEG